jgi:hypothetical protein
MSLGPVVSVTPVIMVEMDARVRAETRLLRVNESVNVQVAALTVIYKAFYC